MIRTHSTFNNAELDYLRLLAREYPTEQSVATERLLLRQFTIEDSQAMYTNWATDDKVTAYLTWPTHTSEEVTKSILNDWVDSYKKPDTYHWAITLKSFNNQPIGRITVVELREKAKVAQLGYCIGSKWWHQGLTSEAFNAVKDFLFDEVGFNRIEAKHDINNPNSGKVMLKCGLKYEGTLKQAYWNNNGICDCSIYGLVNQDR